MPGSSKLTSYCTLRNAHLLLTMVWGLLAIPTLLLWRESVAWVVFMSLYANFASHWSAYQGARAEEAAS